MLEHSNKKTQTRSQTEKNNGLYLIFSCCKIPKNTIEKGEFKAHWMKHKDFFLCWIVAFVKFTFSSFVTKDWLRGVTLQEIGSIGWRAAAAPLLRTHYPCLESLGCANGYVM